MRVLSFHGWITVESTCWTDQKTNKCRAVSTLLFIPHWPEIQFLSDTSDKSRAPAVSLVSTQRRITDCNWDSCKNCSNSSGCLSPQYNYNDNSGTRYYWDHFQNNLFNNTEPIKIMEREEYAVSHLCHKREYALKWARLSVVNMAGGLEGYISVFVYFAE